MFVGVRGWLWGALGGETIGWLRGEGVVGSGWWEFEGLLGVVVWSGYFVLVCLT